jgi:hypothetical protein
MAEFALDCANIAVPSEATMHDKIPSDPALVLLRDLVARTDCGIMLDAGLVALAGELIRAGYAVAKDVERGIELRATACGIGFQEMVEEYAAE